MPLKVILVEFGVYPVYAESSAETTFHISCSCTNRNDDFNGIASQQRLNAIGDDNEDIISVVVAMSNACQCCISSGPSPVLP